MMKRAISIALMWASAAAAMNTNSLSVYCPPPTNAPALDEGALRFRPYDRVINLTNLTRMAAIYDMMCERMDVPATGYVYSRDKRNIDYANMLATNRAAMTASRALKYAPYVDLCQSVSAFLDDGSVTNAGCFTVHPMTFGCIPFGHTQGWNDVGASNGYHYVMGDPILSPGRGNYAYQLAYAGGAIPEYHNKASILPIWLGALTNSTTFTPPGTEWPSTSADAIARLVQEMPYPDIGGPRIWFGFDYRAASSWMDNGVPSRIPVAVIPAQAADLISPLRYTWYSLASPAIFTNLSGGASYTYRLTAEDVLAYQRGQKTLPMIGEGMVDMLSDSLCTEKPKPPMTWEAVVSDPETAPYVRRSRTANINNTLEVWETDEYIVSLPAYANPATASSSDWGFVGTISTPTGRMDVYQIAYPSENTLISSNVTYAGEVIVHETLSEIRPHTWHLSGSLDWPSRDAVAHEYTTTNWSAYMFAHCTIHDEFTSPSGDDSAGISYDLYGHEEKDSPSNAVTKLLGYALTEQPRDLVIPSIEGMTVVATIETETTSPSRIYIAEAHVPHGMPPPSPGNPFEWGWATDTRPTTEEGYARTTVTVDSSGGGTAEIIYKPLTIFGFVEWNFLDLKPE